jgi:hypothetical protein
VPSLQVLLRSAVRQPASCKALSKAFWLPIAASQRAPTSRKVGAAGAMSTYVARIEMSIRNGAKMVANRTAY